MMFKYYTVYLNISGKLKLLFKQVSTPEIQTPDGLGKI